MYICFWEHRRKKKDTGMITALKQERGVVRPEHSDRKLSTGGYRCGNGRIPKMKKEMMQREGKGQ